MGFLYAHSINFPAPNKKRKSSCIRNNEHLMQLVSVKLLMRPTHSSQKSVPNNSVGKCFTHHKTTFIFIYHQLFSIWDWSNSPLLSQIFPSLEPLYLTAVWYGLRRSTRWSSKFRGFFDEAAVSFQPLNALVGSMGHEEGPIIDHQRILKRIYELTCLTPYTEYYCCQSSCLAAGRLSGKCFIFFYRMSPRRRW